ncbi:MAG: hypothetical protein ABJL99_18780 [Aliishimia sp.]
MEGRDIKQLTKKPVTSPVRSASAYMRGVIYGFSREERGSIAVEAVLILPMMFWTYLVIFSSFHAYRTYAVNQKAAYTVGDMISRETNPIDSTYLSGTRELITYMTSAAPDDVSIRVTSVKYDAGGDKYEREWSEAKGFMGAATTTEVVGWADELPVLPDNEVIIVVETSYKYEPPFNVGFYEREVQNFVFTRPRYAPQVCWNSCN